MLCQCDNINVCHIIRIYNLVSVMQYKIENVILMNMLENCASIQVLFSDIQETILTICWRFSIFISRNLKLLSILSFSNRIQILT